MSTLEFKDNIIKKGDERDEILGKLVKERILCEHDLKAAEAKYDRIHYVNLLKQV